MPQPKKALSDLYASRFQIWRDLVNLGDFVRGSVVLLRRPCTRENCQACSEGEKHPATYLSVSQKGKTRLLYLPKETQPLARQWAENYRQLMTVVEKVSDINREILKRMSEEKKGPPRRRR